MRLASCITPARVCRSGSTAHADAERQRTKAPARARSTISTLASSKHAVAYFGSRVLYPSRPAPDSDDAPPLSRAACEKAAQSAVRADGTSCESDARRISATASESQIYDAYLAGKVAPRGLRRLFLAHLDEPGLARKVCAAVIAKLRSVSRARNSRQPATP